MGWAYAGALVILLLILVIANVLPQVNVPVNRNVTVIRPSRANDLRSALLLTYITLAWMTIEGAASLLLGWASKSLLLEAFGIDSIIELFSGAVVLWRLRIEASGNTSAERARKLKTGLRAMSGIRSMR